MDLSASFAIENFLFSYLEDFTVDDFCRNLKTSGVKLSKAQGVDLLNSSDYVFSLVNEEYITRAGVFTGRYFSFKPTKEEIRKGHIILGHRCMPFVNPDIAPDKISIRYGKKIIAPEPTVFSVNLAMDIFALYGEGYVIPYVFNDSANEEISISSIQYNMPNEISLTSWPLNKIPGGKEIKYGDRLLCRVVDWKENEIEISERNGHKVIVFIGQAAHGSIPWCGKNAAMMAVYALGNFYKNERLMTFFSKFMMTRGEGLNADMHNDEMYDNSLNLGLFSYADGKLNATFNFRFINTTTFEEVKAIIEENAKPFKTEFGGCSPLLYFPKDSVLVSTLLNAYIDETGDKDAQPLSTGGGTYAKEAENVVAFGMEFEGWDKNAFCW